MIEIRRLNSAEGRQHLDALVEILADCVEGGASVGFMTPFSKATGISFFEGVLAAVERGDRILLAAFDGRNIVGTVQIVTALPQNQPHRVDIAKLLVPRSARGQGVAPLLMEHVATVCREEGKTLMVLDTVTGSVAERLYRRLGWTAAGVIPRYALFPDGSWCDTTVFWKSLV